MQIIRFIFALSTLIVLLTHAAPISVSDGSDSFEARDGDLWRRASLTLVGPEVRHRVDAAAGAGTYTQIYDRAYSDSTHQPNMAWIQGHQPISTGSQGHGHPSQGHGILNGIEGTMGHGHDKYSGSAHQPNKAWIQGHQPIGTGSQGHGHPSHGHGILNGIEGTMGHGHDMYHPENIPHASSKKDNFENAPKSGGFLKMKAAKAKKALKSIWRKVTGKH